MLEQATGFGPSVVEGRFMIHVAKNNRPWIVIVDTFWELGKWLFQDQHMSPHLLTAGFLQIGHPFFCNYDPVCFDTKSPRIEKRIVQLDHEAILQRGEMHVVKEIAPSFLELIDAAVR